MTEQQAPKIEFPCEDYLIKVIGDAHQEMVDFVLETTEKFAPGFDRNKVSIRESGKGRFHSVTLFITATGLDQLQSYHQALAAHSQIKMVI